MKKKIITVTLAIVLTLVMAITLTACNNMPTHKTLASHWKEYTETSVYDAVYSKDGVTRKGELEISIEPYNGRDLSVSSDNIPSSYTNNNFYGFKVTSSLSFEEDQYKRSVVVVDKQFKTLYSYSVSHFLVDQDKTDKYEDIMSEITYSDKSCEVKGSIDGKENNGKISYKQYASSPYFDNAYFPVIVRTMALGTSSQMSFVTPTPRNMKTLARTATLSSSTSDIEPLIDIKGFELEEGATAVKCYTSSIASAETVPGTGTPIYYNISSKNYKTESGAVIENPLMKFEEHDVKYTLKSISAVKVA